MSKPRSKPDHAEDDHRDAGQAPAGQVPVGQAQPGQARAGRVAIVGRPNVGKSTLLNALLGEAIAITSLHPQTTRDTVRGVLTVGDTQYVFVDTPGLHAPKTRLGAWMNETARQAARDADVLVLVIEAPRDGQEPHPLEVDLKLAAELPKLPTLLAINKIDRLKDKAQLLPLMASYAHRHPMAATVPMSARRTNGTERMLQELRGLLPEQPFLFAPDTLSDQPVRFFVAEFVREQILKQTRQEVPHGVAVIVERFDEGGTIPQIEVAVHVARDAHKKILIGAKGQMLKSIGMAARARVEKMLDRRVHLQLWVRTTPDWMDDPARLRELGYSS
jgi:GTP-binding protein Era